MRRTATVFLVLTSCGLLATACSGASSSSSTSAPPTVAPATTVAAAPSGGSPVAAAPPSRAQQTGDIEADLGKVTADLDAAGKDLQDGPTQATTDPRG